MPTQHTQEIEGLDLKLCLANSQAFALSNISGKNKTSLKLIQKLICIDLFLKNYLPASDLTKSKGFNRFILHKLTRAYMYICLCGRDILLNPCAHAYTHKLRMENKFDEFVANLGVQQLIKEIQLRVVQR